MGGGNIQWWVWAIFFGGLFLLLILGAIFGRKIAKGLRKNKVWAPLADTFEGLSDVGDTINLSKKHNANKEQKQEDNQE